MELFETIVLFHSYSELSFEVLTFGMRIRAIFLTQLCDTYDTQPQRTYAARICVDIQEDEQAAAFIFYIAYVRKLHSAPHLIAFSPCSLRYIIYTTTCQILKRNACSTSIRQSSRGLYYIFRKARYLHAIL